MTVLGFLMICDILLCVEFEYTEIRFKRTDRMVISDSGRPFVHVLQIIRRDSMAAFLIMLYSVQRAAFR